MDGHGHDQQQDIDGRSHFETLAAFTQP